MASSQETQNVEPDLDMLSTDFEDITSTSSLRSSVKQHKNEFGRSYHSYKDTSIAYHRPNDDNELDRLDIIHEMLGVVNDGKLHIAPLGDNFSGRILDVGAGSGLWCVNMGDQYPAAEIVGVDISPSMPAFVPPNVNFEIDDVEEPWTYSQPFDYVHGRYMAAAIKDWEKLIKQCFEYTRPGGWCEWQDFDLVYYSQDGTLTKDRPLKRWIDTLTDGTASTGRTPNPGRSLEQWLKNAGFINVQVIKTPCPLGPWAKNPKMKKIGIFNLAQLMEGFEGLSLRVFMGMLNWSREDLDKLLNDARADLKNKDIHPMFDCYTVWGQRPAN